MQIHKKKGLVEGDEEFLKGLARGAGDAPVRVDVAEFSAHTQEQWKEAVADTALHLPPALVRVVFLLSDHELFSLFTSVKQCRSLCSGGKKPTRSG